MCVIIHKPEGKSLSTKILKQCWERNDDGAGMMYVKDGRVVIEKGFMKFSKFIQRYKALRHLNLVVHMRLASAGVVDKNNTHPFKVDDELAVCHNGTIHSDLLDKAGKKFMIKPKKSKKCASKEYQGYIFKEEKEKKEEKEEIPTEFKISELFGDKKIVTVDDITELYEKYAEIVEEEEEEETTSKWSNDEEVCAYSDTYLFVNEILKKLPKGFLKDKLTVELIKNYCSGSCLVFMDANNKVTILGSFSTPCKINGSWFSNDSWKTTYSWSGGYTGKSFSYKGGHFYPRKNESTVYSV